MHLVYPAQIEAEGDGVRTPAYWNGMPFTAKAAWLVSTRQAKTYEEACSMLGRRRKKPVVKQNVSTERFWWNKD